MTRPICIAGITCIAIAWLGLTRAGEARYFGLVPPDTPQPFAPTRWQAEGRRLTQVAIAPGFRHAAVSVMDDDGTGKVAGAIYESRLEHGEWSLPQRAGGPDLSAGEDRLLPLDQHLLPQGTTVAWIEARGGSERQVHRLVLVR